MELLILEGFLYDFWHNFYGVLMGEYEEHDGNLKIDFWTSFDGGVFWSKI